MFKDYKIGTGSTIGKYHIKTGKNNQDAYRYIRADSKIVGVVCDGCGSGAHSEVGAQLGANIIAEQLFFHTDLWDCAGEVDLVNSKLERSRKVILSKLRGIVKEGFIFHKEFETFFTEYFLFTALCFIVEKNYTYIFSIGDGVYALNGNVKNLGGFESNAPPYVAYGLIPDAIPPELNIKFQINEIIKTENLDTLLIATDGAEDIIRHEDHKISGRNELVGPLAQFWDNDKYYNDFNITRRLTIMNRELWKLNRENVSLEKETGCLDDDTTIIVLKRENNAGLSTRESNQSTANKSDR